MTAKLDGYRGASRFTTWAYGFAVFEVSVKLRRHALARPHDPDRRRRRHLGPAGVGGAGTAQARVESAELLRALRRAVGEELSPRQREVFVAVALNDVEIDVGRRAAALDPRRGLQGAPRRTAEAPPASRARRASGSGGGEMNERDPLTRLLGAPGEDAGCEGGMALLAEYVEGELAGLRRPRALPRPRRAPAQLPGVRGGLRRPRRARPRPRSFGRPES